jgi:hypothetical protein
MGNELSEIVPSILSWKKQYGSIYHVKIGKSSYIFRALTRLEYLTLLGVQGNTNDGAGDIILSECLLSPKFDVLEFDNKLAGEVDSLVSSITKASGFSGTESFMKDIEYERSNLGTLESQIIVLICKAFPHLKLSDINNFTYDDLMRYVAISEAILDVKLNIEKPDSKSKKHGTVDFDKENEAVDGAVPFRRNPAKPRGDVSK